jgi:hypothetical protein
MDIPNPLLSNDVLGWAAALLTLMTFVCRDMRRLRLLALSANAAFIAYGALAQLLPVLALHLALVPVNLWRLNQTLRPAQRRDAAGPGLTSPEPARTPAVGRRRRWTPKRRRRTDGQRTASTGTSHARPRPDRAIAEGSEVRP